MTRLTILAVLLAVCGVVGWRWRHVPGIEPLVPSGWRDLERVDAV